MRVISRFRQRTSRDVIGNPPDGVALLLPFVLDVRRSRLQRCGAENVTLADLACKLLDVCSKALRQRLLFGTHDKPQYRWSAQALVPATLDATVNSYEGGKQLLMAGLRPRTLPVRKRFAQKAHEASADRSV
jgi:hypothetical protein